MSEEPNVPEKITFWSERKYLLLITITIVVALILTAISMSLYTNSGALQLDLSRPGYQAVSSQAISSDNDLQTYPNSGPINEKSTSDFRILYEKQAQKATAVDAYAGDPLNPVSLEISEPTAQ